MDVFPIEIILQILQNLRPIIVPTPAKIDDPSVVTNCNRNWWAGESASSDEEKSNPPLDNTPNLTIGAKVAQGRIIHKFRNRNPQPSPYLDILPLRLVNRLFCEICTPYVYQEMNLLEPVDNRTHRIARQYGIHVRALRVFFGTSMDSNSGNAHRLNDAQQVVDIYSSCPETRYIAFYHAHATLYYQFQSYMERLVASMSFLLHLEKLDTVGVHFLQEKIGWIMDQITNIAHQVLTIASSDRARHIKRLELSIPNLNGCHEVLRTKFTSLEHLSIHTSPMIFYLSDNFRPEVLDWSAYHRLTTMSLSRSRHGTTIYSQKVPEMVRQIPSLQELFISDRGAINEQEVVEIRSLGWSHLPDEWWNQRKPLRYLHIEAAMNATIYYLSVIPVEKVHLILHASRVNFKFLSADEEIFPHLRIFHLERSALGATVRLLGGKEWIGSLSRICSSRDVTLSVASAHVDT
ncbi:hypothetical protein CPB86DRAFT_869243 [Serendipita vermifera]|nr:hypothetical protein CPB86DRAFT_869243 [Serendipita vermifera]